MKDIVPVTTLVKVEKTLDEQRSELRLQLQLNRGLLTYKLSGNEAKNHFPRSMVIRFLTQQTTVHILKKLAYTAIGLKTFKLVQYGVPLFQFIRHKLQQKKSFKANQIF
jgi:hypothetical protein